MNSLTSLNENTAYLKQVLSDYKLSNDQNIENVLDQAIKIIIFGITNPSNQELSLIQTEVYTYLIVKMLDEDLRSKISIRNIINLMAKNGFDGLMNIIYHLDSNTQQEIYEFLQETIKIKNNSDFNYIKFIFHIFIDIVDKETDEIIKLKEIISNYMDSHCNTQAIEAYYFINKILDKIYEVLRIQETNQFESQIEEIYSINSKMVEDYLRLLKTFIISKPCIKEFTKLNSLCYLLSFLTNSESVNKIIVKDISSFFKEKLNNSFEFDDYFTMMHKLYGYKKILEQKISNENNKNLITIKDVLAFEILQEDIKNPHNLLKLLIILDNTQDDTLIKRLRTLFWVLFDDLHEEDKSKLITKTYETRTLSKHQNGSLRCLNDPCYHQNVQTMLNKLLKNSLSDEEIISRLYQFLLIDLEFMVTTFIKYSLDNESQISSIINVFQKFKFLSQLDADNNHSILLNNMKTFLDKILIRQNLKEFECYLVLLKEMLQLKFIDSTEYFHNVLKPLLNINSKTIETITYSLTILVEICPKDYKTISIMVFLVELLFYCDSLLTSREASINLKKIIQIKELAWKLIKSFNELKQINIEDIEREWLKKYVYKIDWTYSFLLLNYSKVIRIPSNLTELLELKVNSIQIESYNDSNSQLQNLLNLSVIDGFKIFNLKNSFQIENLKEFYISIYNVLSMEKCFFEIDHLNELIYELVTTSRVKVNSDNPFYPSLIYRKTDSLMEYMCLMSNIFYLVKDTLSFHGFLISYSKLIKNKLQKDLERSLNIIYSIYFYKKLCIVSENQLPQSFKFSMVELSNTLKRSCEDLDETSCGLIRECLELSTNHNLKDKLITLLDENLNFSLKSLNKQK